ncbi:MAG: ATP-dependent RecD-like DNA helicase [Holosporales bacterium]|jgi:exodeoxyribonuclease V alpha subunit|nr:ATP-dependent RecD-like DNA helicase [Holosporales bacterium]
MSINQSNISKKEGTIINLQGQLERLTYENKENGFTVAKVRIKGRQDFVTVVGNIPDHSLGGILNMQGIWTSHPKFGEQFKIISCSCSVPAAVYGIEKYLGSGLIKGLGPAVAKKIVSTFGEKTFDVIEENPNSLLTIPGVGKGRVNTIKQAWQEQKEIRAVMVFLQNYDVSTAYAIKIYKKYGNDSIFLVKSNPYRLASDIWGIGFATADKIAQNLGFDENSPLRAQAGILFVLQELTTNGHVYYPYQDLIQEVNKVLNIDELIVEKAMQSLLREGKIVIEQIENVQSVYLANCYLAETKIAEKLIKLKTSSKRTKLIDAESAIEWVQKKLSLTLAAKQIEAIKTAIDGKLLVITGSPGTGKTTITKAILEIFFSVTKKIHLTAPTGRAAKRMAEATKHEAKTIHRLLECNTINGGFLRNEENPLDCDLLILDEASMVDVFLMHSLLKAIPKHTTVIIIGDINQLPSVGAGSVLKDIILSGVITVVELNEIFRQAQQSKIIVNSHKIVHGDYPDISNSEETDFFFMQEEDLEKVREKVLRVVQERIPQKFGYNAINDVQVLTPMHRGEVGTNSLNEALQKLLNPKGAEITRVGRKYRVGDKVMQTKNNYDKEVFNGDLGIIKKIDYETQSIIVNIDDRNINYEYWEIEELALAYAISIHKSQGSEYKAVVIPIVMSHYIMLQRNLIYTGITRGKNLVVIIGSQKALFWAVNNNKIMNRNTWLSKRLQVLYTGAPKECGF